MYIYVLFSCLQIDHDVCSNYGNWLYSAGIGNDPRENRKFNAIKQGHDYDADVSIKFIFSPLVQPAWWAHMNYFPSVACLLSLDQHSD